jgi:hypothetical protein
MKKVKDLALFIKYLFYWITSPFNIPIILIAYAIICIPLMLFCTEFLEKYGLILTVADWILWVISTVHIVKYGKHYLKTAINCYFGTLAYLMLERTDIVFKKHYNWYSDELYLSIYVLIVLIVIVKSILDNRQR